MGQNGKIGIALAGIIVAACIGTVTPAKAASLGLTGGLPDINDPSVNVIYSPGSGIFSVSTTTPTGFSVDIGGAAGAEYVITGATLNLSATLNVDGSLNSSATNTITIGGSGVRDAHTMASLASGTQTLTGNITAFGFPTAGGNTFEFQFTVTGGNLQNSPVSFPLHGGVIVNAVGSGFTGSFSSLINATGSADTFGVAVPTPASLTGGFVLLAGFGLWRRRGAAALD